MIRASGDTRVSKWCRPRVAVYNPGMERITGKVLALLSPILGLVILGILQDAKIPVAAAAIVAAIVLFLVWKNPSFSGWK